KYFRGLTTQRKSVADKNCILSALLPHGEVRCSSRKRGSSPGDMNNVVGTVAMTPPFDNEKATNADFQSRFDPGLPTDCTYHTVVLDSQWVNQTNEETWMEIALYYAPNTCALAPLCHLDRGGRRFRGP